MIVEVWTECDLCRCVPLSVLVNVDACESKCASRARLLLSRLALWESLAWRRREQAAGDPELRRKLGHAGIHSCQSPFYLRHFQTHI